MRHTLCAFLLLAGVLVADDAEPKDPNAPKARELKVTGLKGGRQISREPVKVTNAEELTKAVGDKAVEKQIAEQVNFKKEYVVLFRWSGSGGDKLSFAVDSGKKGDVVVFTMTRGRTRDLRQHAKVFAIPAKATYKMGK